MTSLELVVAVALLAVGLVPVLSLSNDTTRQEGFTQGQALAVAHAEALLDRAAALGWARLAAGAATRIAPVGVATPGGFAISTARVTFEVVAPALGQLVVELTWRMGDRDPPRTVRSARLLARPEASWTIAPPAPAAVTLPGE